MANLSFDAAINVELRKDDIENRIDECLEMRHPMWRFQRSMCRPVQVVHRGYHFVEMMEL
jgi:hypothetical protein